MFAMAAIFLVMIIIVTSIQCNEGNIMIRVQNRMRRYCDLRIDQRE